MNIVFTTMLILSLRVFVKGSFRGGRDEIVCYALSEVLSFVASAQSTGRFNTAFRQRSASVFRQRSASGLTHRWRPSPGEDPREGEVLEGVRVQMMRLRGFRPVAMILPLRRESPQGVVAGHSGGQESDWSI